jgi:acetyl-CoA carboxylase biotin carboxyl carrier protein
MDIERIRRVIRLAQESGACEIAVETPEGKVRVLRRPRMAAPAPQETTAAVAASRAPAPQPAEPIPTGDLVVRSRHVGWFHRGEGPGAKAFVEVGDEVREGQALATIETLRMSNQVTAPRAGIVGEILVEEGEEVEYGQELLILASMQPQGGGGR